MEHSTHNIELDQTASIEALTADQLLVMNQHSSVETLGTNHVSMNFLDN